MAGAPALVAPDTDHVEMAEPQVPERPQLANQDVRISDSSGYSLPNDSSQIFPIVSGTPVGIDPVQQRLATEATPTDRQPSRHLRPN